MSRSVFDPSLRLLELNVISGQDLAQVLRKMKTYAVAWVHPDRKLTTRIDDQGHNNPTWNDKFVFRVEDEFLYGETSAIMIEIYALHWFRDVHVGTIRVIVGNLVPPRQLQQQRQQQQHRVQLGTTRFVALQVRRRSGRPQGILNIGVSILDTSRRSMPLYSQIDASAVGYRHLMGEEDPHKRHNISNKEDDKNSDNQIEFLLPWIPKPELRRTKSESSSMFGSDLVGKQSNKKTEENASSMIDGSENKYMNRNFKKRSSKASSIILGSGIFNKHNQKNTNTSVSDQSSSTLAEEKYKSDISGETTLNNRIRTGKSKYPQMNKPTLPYLVKESELGPSASEVAARVTKNKKKLKLEETESEIMGSWSLESSMEGLQSKLERWRAELPPGYDCSSLSSHPISSDAGAGNVHHRRRSDGDGAFSCFGTFCGIECSIVCGESESRKKNSDRVKRSHSDGSFSFI